MDSDLYVSQAAFLWSLFSGLFFPFLFLLDYLYSLLSSQISKSKRLPVRVYITWQNKLVTDNFKR